MSVRGIWCWPYCFIMMRVITRGLIRFDLAIEKKLFVYDAGTRDGTMDYSKTHLYSGIRATIFGASGRVESTQATWAGPSLPNWDWPTAASSFPSTSNTTSATPNTSRNCTLPAPPVLPPPCRPHVD